MLAAFRAFAKSWVAAGLIGLLIVAFAVFGIRDVFGHKTGDSVVTAGSRKVPGVEFRRQFDQVRQSLEQRMGRPVTAEMAAENGLDRRLLQELATRQAFGELLSRMGIRPSDAQVAEQIGKIPAFFSPISGKFDKDLYARKLAENDFTPARFEGELRDDIAQQHLLAALANSLAVPRAYGALAALYTLESRDVAFITLTPNDVPRPAAPTDAELAAFMKENAAQLTRPEFRQLTVVRFGPEAVAANVSIDPAEVRKRYDFRKDTLSTPETRSLVQIPAKDAATAQAIAARLQKRESPQAAAKAAGVDPISYAAKPQSAIPDRKVAEAAFKLQPGQVSTIQGDLGLAVVRVDQVTPGKAVTFEEARPTIEAELRKDAVAEKVYALTQAYDDAHQKGANLVEAAKKAGVEAVVLPPLTRDGRLPTGQPMNGLDAKLADTAFGLPAGGESEVVDAGEGRYFAVRVDKIIPPAMPSLDEIRPMLANAWTMRELGKALRAKADALAARVTKGEPLTQVAAAEGLRVDRATGVDRQSAQQNPLMTEELTGEAFRSKPGDVFVAGAHGGIAVARLEAVHPGDTASLAALTEQIRPQMTSAVFRDMGKSAEDAARRKIKVTVDYARARSALGLEPVAVDAKAKGKDKPELAK